MIKIMFVLVVSLPGSPPRQAQHEMPSLWECAIEVAAAMRSAEDKVLRGGQVQASCVAIVPPRVEARE